MILLVPVPGIALTGGGQGSQGLVSQQTAQSHPVRVCKMCVRSERVYKMRECVRSEGMCEK